jgi:hypothetical protein
MTQSDMLVDCPVRKRMKRGAASESLMPCELGDNRFSIPSIVETRQCLGRQRQDAATGYRNS